MKKERKLKDKIKYKDVLWLRKSGFSFKEIGAIAGCTKQHVHQWIKRKNKKILLISLEDDNVIL